jgi:hypothetical protein
MEGVGYGRPPGATRFRAGESGNPKGRPKGSRPVGSILQDILRQKVSVTEGGKARRISTLEVMLRRLANDAMRSDQKALKFLLTLAERYAESPDTALQLQDLLAEDEVILAEYLKDPPGVVTDAPQPPTQKEGEDET